MNTYLAIVLSPLGAAIIAGLFGRQIGRSGAQWLTIIGVTISFVLSVIVLKSQMLDGAETFNGTVYTSPEGHISGILNFLTFSKWPPFKLLFLFLFSFFIGHNFYCDLDL